MKTGNAETRYKRVWFGPIARVTIGPLFLHKAGVDGFTIPHPPIANYLLRLGLPGDLGRNLSFDHEFAHFQTAPMLFVYMLAILVIAHSNGRTSKGEFLFLLVCVQAAWEVFSESLLLITDLKGYRTAYKGVTRLPRLIFWCAGALLMAAGWVVIWAA